MIVDGYRVRRADGSLAFFTSRHTALAIDPNARAQRVAVIDGQAYLLDRIAPGPHAFDALAPEETARVEAREEIQRGLSREQREAAGLETPEDLDAKAQEIAAAERAEAERRAALEAAEVARRQEAFEAQVKAREDERKALEAARAAANGAPPAGSRGDG
jgi:hypothetical protein